MLDLERIYDVYLDMLQKKREDNNKEYYNWFGGSSAGSCYKKHKLSKKQLALKSIHIEQNLIGETVGSQDQISASYGGFNHILFSKTGDFKVKRIKISSIRKNRLEKHLMLFHSNINRYASKIAYTYVNNMSNLSKPLQKI